MRKLKDVQAEIDNNINLISLEKLVKSKIKEVQGHLTTEFGEPTFQLFRIFFENGDSCFVEGEHDCPYLSAGPELDEEELEKLAEEEL